MPLDLQKKIDLVKTDPTFAITVNGGPVPEDQHLYFTLGSDYIKYTEMRRDPRMRSLLAKRRQSILGRRVIIEPSSDRLKDRVGVEAATRIADLIRYEGLCASLLNSGQLIGFSVLQIDWHQVDDFVLPHYKFVPQNRFAFVHPKPDDRTIPTATGEDLDPETEICMVQDCELRLLTRANPVYGERCPKDRFVVYTFDGDGSPWGLGLGYSAYPWYVVKREATKSWLLHSDRAGGPPVIGTHPPEVKESDPQSATLIRKFEDFLRSISPNGWARLPQNFEAKVLDGLAGAGSGVHQDLIQMADAQMSIAILGEVQYSDKLSGSYAANVSQVEDRESSLIDADVNLLDEQLDDQLWKRIAELNYPRSPRPIVRRETIADVRKHQQKIQEHEALIQQASRDAALISMGLRPTEEYIHETYGKQWSFAPAPAAPAEADAPPPANGNLSALNGNPSPREGKPPAN